jgi:hypothetical protein
MPFVPKYQEATESLLIDNILTIVKRDFAAALTYFYPSLGLPDFAERTVGRFFKMTYPSFAIDPQINNSSDDGQYVTEDLKVNLFFAVAHADPPTVTENAMRYMRALKSILRTATVADYTSGFPANSIFALNVEMSYEYGLIGKNASGYEKPVSIELLLKFNER